MKKDKPVRKSTRLNNFDYSTPNYYFITICTHNKKCIFGNYGKSMYGQIAAKEIESVQNHYSGVTIDKYVVMPNHVHMIVVLTEGKSSLNQIIGQFKSGVSRKIHEINSEICVWQRSFHDHIIRNQKEYEKIWLYIEANPMNWEKDCFYIDPNIGTG